jgi:CheY-like chemotaxis protein
VFLVRAPKAPASAPVEPAQASAATPPSASQGETSQSSPEPSPPPTPAPEVDRSRLVIVADPDEARGKASGEAIRSWGLVPHVVLDGVEAMLAIQRMLPAAVVLDAALPKMFGFQVCEVVKRNESLRETRVVLVGAIHHQDRYRRDPSDLYGADVYIEQPDLPDGLKAIFEEAGLPVGDAAAMPAGPTPTPTPTPPPAPTAPPDPEPEAVSPPTVDPQVEVEPERPTAPPSVDEDPEITAERERAQRLARIAVSEMLLYSPEKFEQAIEDGTLEQVMDLEIQEARALLRQRISEQVRAETDFVLDELNRVAAERGGQG